MDREREVAGNGEVLHGEGPEWIFHAGLLMKELLSRETPGGPRVSEPTPPQFHRDEGFGLT